MTRFRLTSAFRLSYTHFTGTLGVPSFVLAVFDAHDISFSHHSVSVLAALGFLERVASSPSSRFDGRIARARREGNRFFRGSEIRAPLGPRPGLRHVRG